MGSGYKKPLGREVATSWRIEDAGIGAPDTSVLGLRSRAKIWREWSHGVSRSGMVTLESLAPQHLPCLGRARGTRFRASGAWPIGGGVAGGGASAEQGRVRSRGVAPLGGATRNPGGGGGGGRSRKSGQSPAGARSRPSPGPRREILGPGHGRSRAG